MDMDPVTLFAALANATRLRCLVLLAGHGELCVCDLTATLGLSQPHISRHLAQLRESGWVTDRREGVWVYYRISADLPAWALEVLGCSARGLAGAEPFAQDASALGLRPRSGPASCAPGLVRVESPVADPKPGPCSGLGGASRLRDLGGDL